MLPDPTEYFEQQGLQLKGLGTWGTTRCEFHDGSESMRVKRTSGAWVCMSCGVKGGDVLAYEIQRHGTDFVQAAKALGAWVDDGRSPVQTKPTALSARQAIEVLSFESLLVGIEAARIAKGHVPSQLDLARILAAAGRLQLISEAYRT